ncbi:MAG: hypothetical protein HY647_05660, partial [Acidobacteria bacterium]|nr:hypothetical protein [Acidobacteriota bacterium]
VHLGTNYEVTIEAAGKKPITLGGESREADKFVITYSGPNAGKTFQLWFSTDNTRQLLQVRVPFPIGELGAELE